MQKYKVDWLAFSVSFEDDEQTLDPQLLKILGYDLADFDEIPGRFFYNSGVTYRNYVNVFGMTRRDLATKILVGQ